MCERRIDILDGWRSLAVLSMVVWHALWDLELFGRLPAGTMGSFPALLVRDAVGCSFVLLAGISSRFTRSATRRGLFALGGAAAVTLISYLAGSPVWFGILHFMACALLLYAAFGLAFRRLPETAAAGACLALFAAGWVVMQRFRVDTPWLWLIGLRSESFASADYYPLLPWLFLFLAGTAAGGRIRESRAPWKAVRLPAWLTWPGRRSLAIYLLHQPMLYGIFLLTFYLLEGVR